MPLPLRRLLPWLALAAIASFSLYRWRFGPQAVVGHRVTSGGIAGHVLGTGTLEARVKTTITPRIQERLAEVLVDQGDTVKEGQLLARLDQAEFQQQVAVANATWAAARATVERVRADEARAEAVLQQARLDHRRLRELLTAQTASPAEYDKSVESLHVAEADLKRSQATIVEAESQVLTAEKSLLYRREQLAFTEIRSPYDGLIIRRDRDPGGVVVPGSSLLQLIATNELWISAWVDETAISRVAPRQPAQVTFRSEPDRTFPGEVARLGREADRETREFVVEVRLQQLPVNWTIGQRADVSLETGRKSGVLTVPIPFVLWRAGQPGVFVEDHGRARWQDITLGLRGREDVEVLTGLNAGDRVVHAPPPPRPPLVEGQRIRIP